MSHIEELTLYLHISLESKFISGTFLDNEILIYMPQLHTFTFYIDCINKIVDPSVRVSAVDIEQTFTNMKYGQVVCMLDSDEYSGRHGVFSLPTQFHRLNNMKMNIPNVIFNSVTHLAIQDEAEYKYEFFVQLARAFPFLQKLSIFNLHPSFLCLARSHIRDKEWCSIVEYPHLSFLNLKYANINYLQKFEIGNRQLQKR